jgi:hypothetical protein
MRTFTLVRFGFGFDSTLGYFAEIVDGEEKRLCFTLEDERRHQKVPGETCIPVGTYPLALQTSGVNHEKYKKRFGDFHKGMILLQNVPEFEGIHIHPGNTDEDTRGCLLPGRVPVIYPDGEFRVGKSTGAYTLIYERIVPSLIAGETVQLHVTEMQPWA